MANVTRKDDSNGDRKKKFLKTTKQKVVFGIACALVGLFLLSIGINSSITFSNVGVDTLNTLGGDGGSYSAMAPAADYSEGVAEAEASYDDHVTGAAGSLGLEGTNGDNGMSGAVGQAGSDGRTGAKGDKGEIGTTGRNGMDGQNGVDGMAAGAVESYDDFSDLEVNEDVILDEDRKLIYNSSVVLETLNYAKTYDELIKLVNKYKGYIQSEAYGNDEGSYLRADDDPRYGLNVYGTNTLVIRVPRKNYIDFMDAGMKLGNVVEKSQTLEDATSTYATNLSYIDILNKKLEYYDSQLKKLDEELTDAIEKDERARYEQILRDMEYMSSVKAETESQLIPYKQQNDKIDDLSSYATINMSIKEVKEYTKPVIEEEPEEPEHEPTFGERFSEVCNESWTKFLGKCERLLFWFIRNLATLIFLAIIIVIVRIFFWKSIKRWFKSLGETNSDSNDYHESKKHNRSSTDVKSLLTYEEPEIVDDDSEEEGSDNDQE